MAAWSDGRIIEKDQPTANTVRLRLHVDDRPHHLPGQHYILRLRAPDGYTAQRSYSLASDSDDPLLELLIERQPDGEVSEFLADVAEVGDVLELRGPIGRWFVWDTKSRVLCLVGGTGVVPAVAMARTARRLGRTDLLRIAAMGRTPDELAYAAELERYGATLAFTRADVGDRPAGPFTHRGAGAAARGRRPRLRLRLGPLRVVRRGPARRMRPRPGGHPRRALRTDGRLRRSAAGSAAARVLTM